MNGLPKWVDIALIPLINLFLALLVSGLVVLYIGESPVEAMRIMVNGAIGSTYGWGYTLYYATNFIFTGLAVSVAFQARLFNIGGEGQAMLGGLGVALVCLALPWPHWSLALPFAVIGGALFGAAWAAIPAWLQAKQGSHIVITTIMFNYIAASVLVYLLVNVLKKKGSMAPETARFGEGTFLPSAYDMAQAVGLNFSKSAPLNITFFVALLCCLLVYILIWRTKLGYQIRAFGQSEPAAKYAGINPVRITMIVMLISGGMAGLMGLNAVMGEAERLVLNPVQGAGFVGIAVALMGRSHPLGVLIAALLFGMLVQGGGELEFEKPAISKELVLVIQALVIMFTGALDNMIRMPVERLFLRDAPQDIRSGLMIWADHIPGLLLAYGILLVGLLSPGANILTVIGTSMALGRKQGAALAAGVAVGSGLWATLTVLGLSALLTVYAGALILLKIFGVAYLLWLAFKAFRSAMSDQDFTAKSAERASNKVMFLRGLLVQMTNPKAALSWIAIVALGIGSEAPAPVAIVLVLGAFALSLVGHLAYAYLFSSQGVVAFYRKAHRYIGCALAGYFTFAAYKLATSRI